MALRDITNNIKIIASIPPISLGATAAGGKTGDAVDTRGFDSVAIETSVGAISATDATVTAVVLEGDTATGSFTSVADADLIGTEADISVAAGTPRADGVNENLAQRIGYKGVKRYLKVQLVPTISGGIVAGANLVLGHPHRAPTD